MLPVVRTPQASRDLEDILLYIAEDVPDAALRVLDAVEDTLELLSRSPNIGSMVTPLRKEAEGFRVITVKRNRRYLVYFRPTVDCMEIVRIVHGHRDQEAFFSQ